MSKRDELPNEPTDTGTQAEARRFPRLKLPAMYTLVRVRPQGRDRFCWTGYVYDISASGMRLELDSAVEPGTAVEIRAMLPGYDQFTFQATGRVARLHDEADEPGPMRMGVAFDRFTHHADRTRLIEYIETRTRLAA
jgi:hypothetical protein